MTKRNGKFELVSKNCVNSSWVASWLQRKGLDACQCGFECKVRILAEINEHPPYQYVVTKKEFNNLRKELVFIPTKNETDTNTKGNRNT